MNLSTPTTLVCICGTAHTFPAGVGVGDCEGCGIGLVLSEEVTVEAGSEADDGGDCAECHGGGIVRTWRLGPESIDDHETCPTCHGTGNA